MAASGWNDLVPFDGNTDELLATLHQQVFESGDFVTPGIEPEFLDEIAFFDVSAEERAQMAADYDLTPLLSVADRVGLDNLVSWCVQRYENKDLSTLDELRALQCISSSGTHSALDITSFAATPEDSGLLPLTASQVVEVFGKERVQQDDVSAMKMYVFDAIPDAYKRWQAVFVPVYTGDELTHAYVEGCSGD